MGTNEQAVMIGRGKKVHLRMVDANFVICGSDLDNGRKLGTTAVDAEVNCKACSAYLEKMAKGQEDWKAYRAFNDTKREALKDAAGWERVEGSQHEKLGGWEIYPYSVGWRARRIGELTARRFDTEVEARMYVEERVSREAA